MLQCMLKWLSMNYIDQFTYVRIAYQLNNLMVIYVASDLSFSIKNDLPNNLNIGILL